jgi:hypothetical protein
MFLILLDFVKYFELKILVKEVEDVALVEVFAFKLKVSAINWMSFFEKVIAIIAVKAKAFVAKVEVGDFLAFKVILLKVEFIAKVRESISTLPLEFLLQLHFKQQVVRKLGFS